MKVKLVQRIISGLFLVSLMAMRLVCGLAEIYRISRRGIPAATSGMDDLHSVMT